MLYIFFAGLVSAMLACAAIARVTPWSRSPFPWNWGMLTVLALASSGFIAVLSSYDVGQYATGTLGIFTGFAIMKFLYAKKA